MTPAFFGGNATVNSAIIVQTALTTLLARFPVLCQIATGFSSASVKFNQDIITHIVTPTVAKDFNQATGYVPDDQAQVDVPVKIDKHAYAGYAITDVERSTSQIDLHQRYADKVAYALGRKVSDDLMGLILNANFNNKNQSMVSRRGGRTSTCSCSSAAFATTSKSTWVAQSLDIHSPNLSPETSGP